MKRETTLLIVSVLALTGLGLLMVYSTGAVSGEINWKSQFRLAALGLGLMFVASRFDYHRLGDGLIYRTLAVGTLALLVLVLIPGTWAVDHGGAVRWLRLAGVEFQPSELARFALVILLSVKLCQNRERLDRFFSGYLPPFLLACLFAGLVVAENDLGMPAMMMAASMMILFAAGVRWRHLAISLAPVVLAAVLLIVLFPHRMDRFNYLRDPWSDRWDKGYQLIQSLWAFAQGGLLGRGAGAGEQKLGYLSAAHTDFVFASIGEELGLVGTLAVVFFYGALLYAAFRIAMNAADLFGALLATGLASVVGVQATFIMLVNVGLLPIKGLTLPFVSYGGTSLVAFLAMMGVLVNIGVQAKEPEPERKLLPTA